MVRRIIKVVEEKCEGCGTCITVCSKGALTLSNGKAKLVKEKICDITPNKMSEINQAILVSLGFYQ